MGIDAMSRGQAAGNLVVLTGAAVLYVAAWMLLSWWLPDDSSWLDLPSVVLVRTLFMGLSLAGLALLQLRSAGLGSANVGLTRRSLGANLLWGIPAILGSFAALYVCALVIRVVWPAGAEQMSSNPDRIREMLPPLSVPLIVVVSVIVGFYEEVLFRGVLLTHVRRITGSRTAGVIVNSALFAVLHVGTQESVAIAPLLAVAVLWSLIVLWRKSLVPVITAHAMFDALQLVFLLHPDWAPRAG